MVEKDIKIIELHVNDKDAKENIEQSGNAPSKCSKG